MLKLHEEAVKRNLKLTRWSTVHGDCRRRSRRRAVLTRRPAVLRRLHAIDARRLRESRWWVAIFEAVRTTSSAHDRSPRRRRRGRMTVARAGTVATAQYHLDRARSRTSIHWLRTRRAPKVPIPRQINHQRPTRPVLNSTGGSAGPWIMGPVMANCARRSNAFVGLRVVLHLLRTSSEGGEILRPRVARNCSRTRSARRSCPQRCLVASSRSPARARRAKTWRRAGCACTVGRRATTGLIWNRRTLWTRTRAIWARRRCSSRALFCSAKGANKTSGVVTPAVGLGSALLERLEKTTPASFEISEGTAPPTPPSGKFCLFF